MVTFPYWVFFEWMAPLLEAGGIIYYVYLIVTGQITWMFALILLLFVYSFSVMITIVSVLWDELTGMKYASKREILRLCAAALAEPFLYHPLVVFFSLKGNFFFFTGRRLDWGVMTRTGFNNKAGSDDKRRKL